MWPRRQRYGLEGACCAMHHTPKAVPRKLAQPPHPDPNTSWSPRSWSPSSGRTPPYSCHTDPIEHMLEPYL